LPEIKIIFNCSFSVISGAVCAYKDSGD
jgi:hypothetical protein